MVRKLYVPLQPRNSYTNINRQYSQKAHPTESNRPCEAKDICEFRDAGVQRCMDTQMWGYRDVGQHKSLRYDDRAGEMAQW